MFTEVNLDKGSVEATFEFLYVATFQALTEVLKVDRNVTASYLTNTITTALKQTYDGSFSHNSLNVLVRVWADYGRWSLDPRAKLTDEADALLKADAAEFAVVYGTRYIATESRQNAVLAVLTIESVSSTIKQTMDSTLSGGVGIGKLSANAKELFTTEVKRTSESDRLSINVYALGGKGTEGFKDMITASINREADPLKSIATSIATVLDGMNMSNAVPYSFVVGDMRNFGLKYKPPVTWSEQRARTIKALSERYESASIKHAVLKTIEAGKHPLNRMAPEATKEVGEEIKQYELHMTDVTARHVKCRQETSPPYDVPRAPAQTVLDVYLDLLRPPTVQFLGMNLDTGQPQPQEIPLDVLGIILDARQKDRPNLIKRFFPRSAGVSVTISPQGLYLSTFELFDNLHGSTRKKRQSWDAPGIGYIGSANVGFVLWSTSSPDTGLESNIFAEMRNKDKRPLVYIGDTIDYSYSLSARVTDKANRQFTFLLMECRASLQVTEGGLTGPDVSSMKYYPMGMY